MSIAVIQIDAPNEVTADMAVMLRAQTNDRFQAGQRMMQFWRALMGGARNAKVVIGTGAAKASGTITFSSFAADDTVTINGVTLTAKASPATEAEFAIGASDTAAAVALAAAIIAHSTLGTILTATSALGVTTVTALRPGKLGNCVTTAISARGSVAAARLTGGLDGTEVTHYYGSGY